MKDRYKFRIPMFSDKGSFCEFQYIELGDEIECTLCGSNGEPQQCTGLFDKNNKLIYEGDILEVKPYPYDNSCSGVVVYNNEYARFEIVSSEYTIYVRSNCLIIGNIYQDKELINV